MPHSRSRVARIPHATCGPAKPICGALLLFAACATAPRTPPAAPARPESHEPSYLVKELPLITTARIEEVGEKELRAKLRHDRNATELALEGEYAFADRIQLDVEVPYTFRHGIGAAENGVDAVEIGLRGSVLEDPRELALSLGAAVSAPVDDHQTDYRVRAFVARQFDGCDLHASGGILWDAHDHAFPWSVAAVTTLGQVHPTLELFGVGNATTIAPGLVYQFDRDLEAAIAVPLRLAGNAESVGIAVTFLIEW